MPTSDDDAAPIALLNRAAALLEVFGARQTLTLAEITRYSHVPRSSTHRILQGLVQLGWIERHGAEYTLGLKMFEFGRQAVRQRRVPEAALPVMADLHRRTGLTAHLSVLTGTHVLHIERFGMWPAPAVVGRSVSSSPWNRAPPAERSWRRWTSQPGQSCGTR